MTLFKENNGTSIRKIITFAYCIPFILLFIAESLKVSFWNSRLVELPTEAWYFFGLMSLFYFSRRIFESFAEGLKKKLGG
jgi:hypothetical protein